VTGEPWDVPFEGSRRGSVHGTSVHGIFDDDAFRHSFMGTAAQSRGRLYEPSPVPYHAAVETHLDHLATWLGAHLDLNALDEIATSALPPSDAPGWV
jgi:adenosylcobyric acid synthase